MQLSKTAIDIYQQGLSHWRTRKRTLFDLVNAACPVCRYMNTKRKDCFGCILKPPTPTGKHYLCKKMLDFNALLGEFCREANDIVAEIEKIHRENGLLEGENQNG